MSSCIRVSHVSNFYVRHPTGSEPENIKLGTQRAHKVQSFFDEIPIKEKIVIQSVGEAEAKVLEGSVSEMGIDRKVEVLAKWGSTAIPLTKAEYQTLQNKQLNGIQLVDIQSEKLNNWIGLDREQVNDQLRLYGIQKPRSNGWYSNPRSPDYLPPESEARTLFRQWLRSVESNQEVNEN